MKNWIRVGGRYINLDQVIEISRDEKRTNYASAYVAAYEDADGEWQDGGFPIEPCIVFYCAAIDGADGMMGAKEILFFGEDYLRLLNWLSNDVEAEITNINFADTGWK